VPALRLRPPPAGIVRGAPTAGKRRNSARRPLLQEASMATFVLVHGGWHGGWCWQKVIPFLEAAGHEVYAPTLTGLAERASELSRDVGLDTHIQDIVGLLEEKNLHGVILVGLSYGAMVIPGVC